MIEHKIFQSNVQFTEVGHGICIYVSVCLSISLLKFELLSMYLSVCLSIYLSTVRARKLRNRKTTVKQYLKCNLMFLQSIIKKSIIKFAAQ